MDTRATNYDAEATISSGNCAYDNHFPFLGRYLTTDTTYSDMLDPNNPTAYISYSQTEIELVQIGYDSIEVKGNLPLPSNQRRFLPSSTGFKNEWSQFTILDNKLRFVVSTGFMATLGVATKI